MVTEPELELIQQSTPSPRHVGATRPEPGGSAASRGPLSYSSQIRLSRGWVRDWGDQLVLVCPGLFWF